MDDALRRLDEQLTRANLDRARALVAVADTVDRSEADRFERAVEESKRIGLAYLRARYEYEAKQAGLYIDPTIFEDPADGSGEEN